MYVCMQGCVCVCAHARANIHGAYIINKSHRPRNYLPSSRLFYQTLAQRQKMVPLTRKSYHLHILLCQSRCSSCATSPSSPLQFLCNGNYLLFSTLHLLFIHWSSPHDKTKGSLRIGFMENYHLYLLIFQCLAQYFVPTRGSI